MRKSVRTVRKSYVNYALKFDELCAEVYKLCGKSIANYAQKFNFLRTVYFKKWENQGFFRSRQFNLASRNN